MVYVLQCITRYSQGFTVMISHDCLPQRSCFCRCRCRYPSSMALLVFVGFLSLPCHRTASKSDWIASLGRAFHRTVRMLRKSSSTFSWKKTPMPSRCLPSSCSVGGAGAIEFWSQSLHQSDPCLHPKLWCSGSEFPRKHLMEKDGKGWKRMEKEEIPLSIWSVRPPIIWMADMYTDISYRINTSSDCEDICVISWNRGTPKSSIFIVQCDFPWIKPSILGFPHFWNLIAPPGPGGPPFRPAEAPQRSARNSLRRRRSPSPTKCLSHGWLQRTRALTPVQLALAKTLEDDGIYEIRLGVKQGNKVVCTFMRQKWWRKFNSSTPVSCNCPKLILNSKLNQHLFKWSFPHLTLN